MHGPRLQVKFLVQPIGNAPPQMQLSLRPHSLATSVLRVLKQPRLIA